VPTASLGLPDVYVQRLPRAVPPPRVRTDVAGLVGFEPRVVPADATLTLVPVRHRVSVRLQEVQLRIGDERVRIAAPAPGELVLTEGASEPLADGESRVFTVVAALPRIFQRRGDGREPVPARPFAVAGMAVKGVPSPPDGAAVQAALTAAVPLHLPAFSAWTRLADAVLRREGPALWLTVHPLLGPTVCEDWHDYVLQLGDVPEDGTCLAAAVRAFFANGGDRCHVATVRRPFFTDSAGLDLALADMVGDIDAGLRRATGVARLLLIEEVALVAAPDLHSRRPAAEAVEVPIPPSAADADFRPCGPDEPPPQPATGTVEFDEPLYADLDLLFDAERAMLDLVAERGLGVELIVTAPLELDARSGRYRPPEADAAVAWRDRWVAAYPADEDRRLSFAACYWPWLRTQATVGAPVRDEPPVGAALGIVARRDLLRGPFVAPANEDVRGVVATSSRVEDDDHRRLYDPSLGSGRLAGGAVDVFRPFPTRGIELWGSRTLAADRWMRHLPVRRGLSAIERQAAAALAEIVFEPNSPLLQIRVTHLIVGLLLQLFEAGALRGDTAEEAFLVRCDDSVNPPESIADGLLLCEVRVALAAPSEFLVFRLGRQDAGIQVLEP